MAGIIRPSPGVADAGCDAAALAAPDDIMASGSDTAATAVATKPDRPASLLNECIP
jgi:hypothetical protein